MVSFPHCKINLGLQILSKRPDGYHSISTCFYPVPWTDVLEVLPSKTFSFSQTGIVIPGKPEENLCVRAYQLLKKDFDISGTQIHLHKIIPTGAGLGGGSSDAAQALLTINQVAGLGISDEKLLAYAKVLGSDCPFFIKGTPAIGSGRGDELEPLSLDLKGHYLVIHKPALHVPTAEAYAAVKLREPIASLRSVLKLPVNVWRDQLQNDFEKTVFEKHPSLGLLKDQLYQAGALYASMSGSGSAIFGIFDKEVSTGRLVKGEASWSGWL